MYRFSIFAAALAIGTAMPAATLAQSANSAETKRKAVGSLSDALFTEGRTQRKLAAQIMLDRAGFSPGVIDGYGGGNTEDAVRGYQEAKGLSVDGVIGDKLMQSLRGDDSQKFIRVIRLKQKDVGKTFSPIPESMAEQAKRKSLGYETLQEMIAERYHMDVDLLTAMNPDVKWASAKAGTPVLVVRAGPAKLNQTVDRIVVDRSENTVRAYAGETLLALYPATVGSSDLPSPSGTMTVRAVAPEANYTFNPETNNWGGDEALTLAAGPNNPVGGVWIDLSKETYGIHGSPDPALIGKTASHGCVRLTNWDARELADAVKAGATVEFTG